MIRPQRNACRHFADLSGVWRIAFDESGADDWSSGIPADRAFPIAVPGSWNEQLAEAGFMNFCGVGWLETEVFLPALAPGRALTLHFGSVDFYGEVWLDGEHLGASSAPMLPFALPVPAHLATGRLARLVVRVDAQLHPDEATQGITQATYAEERRPRDEYLPAVRFDFFPYGGINRPVLLAETPAHGLTGWRATSDLAGVTLVVEADAGATVRALLRDASGGALTEAPLEHGHAELRLEPLVPQLWSPDSPHLYRLDIEVLDAGGAVIDAASQQVGLRTFTKDGHRLDLADQFGVLVIDEVFSINLDFRRTTADTLARHKRAVTELIARDASRTCVIAWSLANEPGYLAEANYREASAPYWRELFDHARALDPTRPMTHANVGYAGNDDPAFGEADFIGMNRYHGWYSNPGQIGAAVDALRRDLDAVAVHGKPVMLLEFGADALAGQHATYDQLFTEEYQERLIAAYWAEIERHPAVAGGHVWNFADFRTAQHGRRVVHNLKGVFTRTREPKMAAWTLRRLWGAT